MLLLLLLLPDTELVILAVQESREFRPAASRSAKEKEIDHGAQIRESVARSSRVAYGLLLATLLRGDCRWKLILDTGKHWPAGCLQRQSLS